MPNNYSNLFVWMLISDKLIIKITYLQKNKHPQSDTKTIFKNLALHDIILNDEENPYLWNLVKNALNHPEKKHYVVYGDYMGGNGNLKKFAEFFNLNADRDEVKKFFSKNLDELFS